MQTIISQKAEQVFREAEEYKIVQSFGFETIEGGFTSDKMQIDAVKELCNICHEAAASRGWWHTPFASYLVQSNEELVEQVAYQLKERNVGEMIALMHSELSEALEAARKNLQSDHITEFTGLEEELADCLIRIFDFAGAAQLRLGEAFVAKMKYNSEREDHKMSERMKEGGKKI